MTIEVTARVGSRRRYWRGWEEPIIPTLIDSGKSETKIVEVFHNLIPAELIA